MIGIVMFLCSVFFLLLGFPVAFSFGAIAVLFGFIMTTMEALYYEEGVISGLYEGFRLFAYMPYRIFSIMENSILIAIPLFIFMGIVLQKSQLAEKLLHSMGSLFGKFPGGIAISTFLVGALLAASTGVVGASVIAMGVISLPVMLKQNYPASISCGVVTSAGTLGQIIPPSIVLIILADVLRIPVGDAFREAFIPGITLIGLYIAIILAIAILKPDSMPAIVKENKQSYLKELYEALKNILPPLTLVILVLGSIFFGIATPTESSAIGAIGSIVLSALYKQFSLDLIMNSARETVRITSMVIAILIGATAFSMVFAQSGGEEIIKDILTSLPGDELTFILISMLVVFLLGFFMDFIEISYIILPLLIPSALALDINLVWFAILVAVNLQTSFLTPPFGFSLFYLKGVAPASVSTTTIYKGVIPFIALQICLLFVLALFPEIFGLSHLNN